MIQFSENKIDAPSLSQISAADLAYLGDCVLELLVREHLVLGSHVYGKSLTERSRRYVTAVAQSDAVERILDTLTEEEAEIYRRGRNMNHVNVPKTASQSQYRRATGLECLFGWLYLKQDTARLNDLFQKGFRMEETTKENPAEKKDQ